jgi:hypothetical protein
VLLLFAPNLPALGYFMFPFSIIAMPESNPHELKIQIYSYT